MESVLNGLDMSIAIIYIDDVVVPGRTFEQAAEGPEKVLHRLQEKCLKVKTKKYHLFQREVKFLGHMVSQQGIKPLQDKVQELADWPVPCTASHVRSVLGLVGYYRKMIPGFAEISIPLNNLTKPQSKFMRTLECEQAVNSLKKELMGTTIMAYLIAGCPFIVDKKASNLAAGGVLSQIQDGQERAIMYWSRAFTKTRETTVCPKGKHLLWSWPWKRLSTIY